MKKTLLIFIVIKAILTAPSKDFVVRSTEEAKKNVASSTSSSSPIIYDMGIQSNISNRFASTLVTSRVKNPSITAEEVTFTVVLPEKAFISEFVLHIEGKEYKAYVKEKEQAKQIYEQAVKSGQTAGHVSVSARDSNQFLVSVNIEPEAKASFLLTYEELLERKNNQYELVVNIHPGQVVDNLHVQVYINESRPLTFVRTPSIRSGNEIDKNNENLDPSTDIEIIENKTAVVKFTPDANQQKHFAKELGTKESEGLSGQFVIQYDVERDPYGGEVLLQDGYFVHFFAPDDLPVLSKYIVFVLDTSGSMSWNKIDQMKDAMKNILDQLKPGDYVSLIEFNTDVYGWNIDNESKTMIELKSYETPFDDLNVEHIPKPSEVQDQTISKAKKVIQTLGAFGGTNIIAALEVALVTVKLYLNKNQEASKSLQPMVMFLTDGDRSDTEEITRIISKINLENNHVPIYSLSFGRGANKEFLRKLSLNNFGFSRHIYEASDASLQLQNFYKQIASPLLSNIKFKYNDVVNVTKVDYPVLDKGSEIIVGGFYKGTGLPTEIGSIDGISTTGKITLKPHTIGKPISSLERLWAYLTLKQTLEQRDIAKNKEELTNQALDLALKYSFVTDVTSLIVVKPNITQRVTLETARPDDVIKQEGGNRIADRRLQQPAFISGWAKPPLDSSYSSRHSVNYESPQHAPYQPVPIFDPRDGSPLPEHISRIGSYDDIDDYDYEPIWSKDYRTSSISEQKAHGPMFTTTTAATTTTTTTTLPPTLSSTALSAQNLDSLSWLRVALNPNGTLTVNGGIFKIEENYQSSSNVECPQTPSTVNESGSCKLLKDCPEVYPHLTDFQVYQQYFCPVDNLYAGVCCPKKVIATLRNV